MAGGGGWLAGWLAVVEVGAPQNDGPQWRPSIPFFSLDDIFLAPFLYLRCLVTVAASLSFSSRLCISLRFTPCFPSLRPPNT